jgi:hypothetical protein
MSETRFGGFPRYSRKPVDDFGGALLSGASIGYY